MTIDEWEDPYPAPVLTEHEGFVVVRDDLLEMGTKVRGLDYLIGHTAIGRAVHTWVFGGCPAEGYAQVSLPFVCRQYKKRCILFMAYRAPERWTELQKQGMQLGARYQWIKDGMLTVTLCRAREYAAKHASHTVALPLGLEHFAVIKAFAKVARNLPYAPKEFWTVASSGTLNRSLQQAWPRADANIVSVGHKMTTREIGRARVYTVPYKFSTPTPMNERPPFPSCVSYDAKAWAVMRQHARPGALFWNVAG